LTLECFAVKFFRRGTNTILERTEAMNSHMFRLEKQGISVYPTKQFMESRLKDNILKSMLKNNIPILPSAIIKTVSDLDIALKSISLCRSDPYIVKETAGSRSQGLKRSLANDTSISSLLRIPGKSYIVQKIHPTLPNAELRVYCFHHKPKWMIYCRPDNGVTHLFKEVDRVRLIGDAVCGGVGSEGFNLTPSIYDLAERTSRAIESDLPSLGICLLCLTLEFDVFSRVDIGVDTCGKKVFVNEVATWHGSGFFLDLDNEESIMYDMGVEMKSEILHRFK
jgi:hypothetical protein